MRYRIILITLVLFQLSIVCINYEGQYLRLTYPFSNYDVDYFSFQNESNSEITLFAVPLNKNEAKKFFSSGVIHNSLTKVRPKQLGVITNSFTILIDENNIKRKCEYNKDGKLTCNDIFIQKEDFIDGLNYLKIKVIITTVLLVLLLLNFVYIVILKVRKKLPFKMVNMIPLILISIFLLIYSGYYTIIEWSYLFGLVVLF